MNKSEKNLVILQNELDETDAEIRLKSAIVQAEQRITMVNRIWKCWN